jgi:hypothetical protein
MITTGSSSIELKFEVLIHNGYLDYTSIQRVNVELEEGKHNLATLEIAGIPPEYLDTYIDLPISIRITVGGVRSHTFYGYIVYLEPTSENAQGLVNKSPFQTTKVYCFGASYVMRSRRTEVHNNKTIVQIAKEFAEKYNFTVSVPNNPYVYSRLVQAGESDWGFLSRIAEMLGYRVLMRGVHIDIWDPFALFERVGTTPLYAMSGNRGSMNAASGQVIKFHGVVGAVTPTSAKVPDTIHALVDGGVATLSMDVSSGLGTSVKSIFSDEIAKNADSIDMAKAILTGRSRQKFPYTAHVDVVGDPSLEPGMLVNIDRYNSALDGIWLIKSVRHEMFRGSSMSYLTLVKDSNFSDVIDPVEKVPPAPELTNPFIKNMQWVTPHELVNIY